MIVRLVGKLSGGGGEKSSSVDCPESVEEKERLGGAEESWAARASAAVRAAGQVDMKELP